MLENYTSLPWLCLVLRYIIISFVEIVGSFKILTYF